MPHRLAIALLGKGSTNHLHRQEVVDALNRHGVEVTFWVRDDYLPLVEKMSGCRYLPCHFGAETGWKARICQLLEHIRGLYPSQDLGRRAAFRLANRDSRGLLRRGWNRGLRFLARFRGVVSLCMRLERGLRQTKGVGGIDASSVDQLLCLGIGTINSEWEGLLTLWAREHGLPVVHIVGNYDNLSSKGFRGVSVDRLLVWGPNMRDDAIRLHGIPSDRITMVGSIRYNGISRVLEPDRKAFVRSLGLDPERKTILFAGFMLEFHYFEMLELYDSLRQQGEPWQLIVRVYPSKGFMNSVYMKPLLHYARSLPGVYVSLGDPHARAGVRDREVLQIEERELWNALNCCDVLVNQFSTISLEGCLFDKPVVNMWYFQRASKAMGRPPVFTDYSLNFHNRRIVSYGAIRTARSRKELVERIREALARPDELSSQRRETVRLECGVLDGRACDRLAEACIHEYNQTQNPGRSR